MQHPSDNEEDDGERAEDEDRDEPEPEQQQRQGEERQGSQPVDDDDGVVEVAQSTESRAGGELRSPHGSFSFDQVLGEPSPRSLPPREDEQAAQAAA